MFVFHQQVYAGNKVTAAPDNGQWSSSQNRNHQTVIASFWMLRGKQEPRFGELCAHLLIRETREHSQHFHKQ